MSFEVWIIVMINKGACILDQQNDVNITTNWVLINYAVDN